MLKLILPLQSKIELYIRRAQKAKRKSLNRQVGHCLNLKEKAFDTDKEKIRLLGPPDKKINHSSFIHW